MSDSNTTWGEKITFQTLVGFSSSDFPKANGNCFSMSTASYPDVRIVNFNVENMEELIRRGLQLPVKIRLLSPKIGLINDERISNKWYDKRVCETCCPRSLLPYTQQDAINREYAAKLRTDFEVEGKPWIITSIGEQAGSLKQL